MWYRLFVRPILYLFDAEFAHHMTFGALRMAAKIPFVRAAVRLIFSRTYPSLETEVWGRTFKNPIGLAAGFDKNAEGIEALSALGFGFIEVGTVTGEAQPGNPTPRLFRLPKDRALINRMGFNNHGAQYIAQKLKRLFQKKRWVENRNIVLGINIGKTKIVSEEHAVDDYLKSAQLLCAYGDYLVVNVSSPNTPGLRNLQQTEKLRPLLHAIREKLNAIQENSSSSKKIPLLVKIAPDLSNDDVDDVAELALELGLQGIVATNTTICREGLQTGKTTVHALGAGGLSGAPLQSRSLEVLERLYRKVGKQIPLVAVGGIENAEDAWKRICHGASLIQVYTGFVYEGPSMPKNIAKGLQRKLQENGFQNLHSAIGSAIGSNVEDTSLKNNSEKQIG